MAGHDFDKECTKKACGLPQIIAIEYSMASVSNYLQELGNSEWEKYYFSSLTAQHQIRCSKLIDKQYGIYKLTNPNLCKFLLGSPNYKKIARNGKNKKSEVECECGAPLQSIKHLLTDFKYTRKEVKSVMHQYETDIINFWSHSSCLSICKLLNNSFENFLK